MELDELKKSWQTIDRKLQDKQLVSDDKLLRIIQQKKNNATSNQIAILRNNAIMMVIAFLLLAYVIWLRFDHISFFGELYFWCMISLAAIVLPWNIFTMQYLKKTQINEMPLTTVIARINRYNYWMTIERVLGIIILFAFALISLVHLKVWEMNGWFLYFFCGLWLIMFVVYLILINRFVFRRLKNIRKNLDELKEVNE